MTIQYVANARIPSRKAHPYQIVQMCAGFEAAGEDVELVVPDRRHGRNAVDGPAESYFDTRISFDITKLRCIDFIYTLDRLPSAFGLPIFYLQALTFSLAALWHVLRGEQADLIYTRSLLFALLCSIVLPDRTVVELHQFPSRRWVARLLGRRFERLRGVVTISEGLRREWDQATDADIVVEPDGVRLDRFDADVDRSAVRGELSTAEDRFVACYAGSVKPWKGVDTLVRAAATLEDVDVWVVGGTDDQLAWLRETVGSVPGSVTLVGHVRPEAVPRYLAASDCLVLPNTADSDISSRYTSPLKLFEYMAAGRPIVASDLPSIREVLDEESAFFFDPDDPASLAACLRTVRDGDDADDRTAAARNRVERYTWTARAERILDRYASGR
ncbi:glycosyltransferase [Halapricum sp. CBA1109]|uniref:glycosyltransferase family 4 protein n=1 Tax=Halapricum sp. CBA1109 TaxID=2668068 RepID=UPI0012F747AD|nr:glycosyltransferase family 4 protein [Halapricum sp. CBA1109]MUV88784.1 glycosyltransferase [Halapricum sp. CBA1109]